MCISAAEGLRCCVLEELHATPLGSHFSSDKTMALVWRLVWWPCLAADVTAFIASCPPCQRTKTEHGPQAGLLFPLPVPSRRGPGLPRTAQGALGPQLHAVSRRRVDQSRVAGPDLQVCHVRGGGSQLRSLGFPRRWPSCPIGTSDSRRSFGLLCTARWAPPSFLGR